MEQRIQKAVEKFATGLAEEIANVIYDDLIDDLQTQRASNKGLITSTKRGVKAARRKSGTAKATAKKNGKATAKKNGKATAKKNGKAKKVSGAKRTPAQIGKLAQRALASIAKEPGRGIEAIAKDLKVETRELSVPVKKLLAEKEIRTTGERRATRYFPKTKRAQASN